MLGFINNNFQRLKLIAFTLIGIKILVLGLLIFRLLSIDSNQLLIDTRNQINSLGYGKFEIGEAKYSYFPFPSIKFEKIISKDLINGATIEFKDITLSPSLPGLLLGDLSPYLFKAKEINYTEQQFEILSENIEKYVINFINAKIPAKKIEAKKLTLSFKNLPDMVIESIHLNKSGQNLYIQSMLPNKIQSQQDIKYVQEKQYFSNDIVLSNSNFRLNSTYYFNDKTILSGSFKANTKNLLNAANDISSILDLPFKNFLASNVQVSIAGDIVNQEGVIGVNKAIIKGNGILAQASFLPMEGTGGGRKIFSIDFAKFDINILDINTLGNIQKDNDLTSTPKVFSGINFAVYINEFNIQNIKLSELSLEGLQTDNNLMINQGSALYNQKGQLYFWGLLENNQIRPRFTGNIELNGDDTNTLLSQFYQDYSGLAKDVPFFLQAQITLTPKEISLSNLSLRIADKNIDGSLGIKIQKQGILIGDLYLANFDMENSKISIFKDGYNYLRSLFQEMQSSDYPSKFTLLRGFPFRAHVSSCLDEMIVGGKKIDRVRSVIDLTDGQLKFSDFYISAESQFVEGDLRIVATTLKPGFYLSINNLYYDTNYEASDIEKIIKFANENISPNSMDLKAFVNISRLKLFGLNLDNVKFNLANQSGFFTVSNGVFDTLGGTGKLASSFKFNPFKASFASSLEQMSINDLSSYLGRKFFITEGFISANAKGETRGANLESILKFAKFNGNFLGKNIVFDKLDIQTLISTLMSKNLTQDIANKSFDYYAWNGATEITDVSGEYEYNDKIFDFTLIQGASDLFKIQSVAQFNITSGFLNMGSNIFFYPKELEAPKDQKDWLTLEMSSQGLTSNLSKSLKFKDGTDISKIKMLKSKTL